MSDAARSSRSALPLGHSALADYFNLLLEGGSRSFSFQEPEVPPMPANHQYQNYNYDTDFHKIPMVTLVVHARCSAHFTFTQSSHTI